MGMVDIASLQVRSIDIAGDALDIKFVNIEIVNRDGIKFIKKKEKAIMSSPFLFKRRSVNP